MNIKLYNIYGFICIFPVWIFKSNLVIADLVILFLLLTILPALIHKLIQKYYIQKQASIIYIWLSLISFYSIDQNLGLWVFSQNFPFIQNFTHFYRAIYFSILIILFLNLFFFILKHNAIKILLSFVIVVFIFNIFDNSKNYSNFPKADLSNKKQQIIKNTSSKKIILILDEMSGLNSLDSNVENGDYFNKHIIDFFLQNSFDIYTNAFSLFKSTDKSLSSVFNFIKNKQDYRDINKSKEIQFLSKSSNYFTVNDLTNNKFFDLEENKNIVVQQSMFINFCNHPKVIICNQFDPFDENRTFLNGFKNSKLTKYVSIYRNNGSIFSRLIWRALLEIRLIDTLLDPDGEKASIQYIFKQLLESIIENRESSLFLSHILVPHIPYGFKKNCDYDGNKTTNFNSLSIEQKKTQHNLEKYCLVKFLDEFITKLKVTSDFENLEIMIFSDHDSRIDPSQIENNVIFVNKRKGSKKPNLIKDKFSINELFFNLN